MFEWSDADVQQRIKRGIERQRNMPAFTATKFGREYEGTRPICDEDCAEFLSGARFDIPYPPKSDEAAIRQMRDALQKAWILLDGLRDYRDDAELLAILRSSQMEDARESVRQAAMIRIGRDG